MHLTNPFRQIRLTLCSVAALILLIVGVSLAQTTQPNTAVIVERLNSLERENQRFREDFKDLKKENEKLKEKDGDLEKSLKEYEPFKYWSYWLGLLGFVSVGGVILLWWKIIPKKVDTQVDAIITKLLTDRRDDLMSLLKEYDFEKSVKQRHQIVLLSHRNGSDDYHVRMLEKNGFKVKPFTKLEQLRGAEFADEDILVINNDGDHWTVEEVQGFINGLTNYCFYFGNGRVIINGDRLDRFTAANFRTQFIGNLMNVLKYTHHQN